jgi:magnesium-dependent phosphatase 1
LSKPQLIVFDLDFTLWDCGGTWCDCLSPPFDQRCGEVLDRTGRQVRLYEGVSAIFDDCDKHEIPMALASRTEQPEWACELLKLLEIDQRFAFAEIYPSSKIRHFKALAEQSGVMHDEMLFFDDEMRNIHEVSRLGVESIYVEAGLTRAVFEEGLFRFRSC